ncbi:hypothetical protein [Mycolicibacterium sp.]|uniref:hypothetical protein n=1 Tax=Mycolicibacterium sp. TaxID=2320850 RepID=UPI0037C4F656
MDPRAQRARDHHRKAADASRLADQHRAQRDELIRQLWDNARDEWTYASLAKAVGCSPELIAKIITRR